MTIATFYERLHPDDRERTRSSIETSIASKQPYDIDYRTVSPDGRDVKWIRASGRGFYDDAGNPIRFDGITIDTTDRVRAEQALRESESRFRQLADAVPQMVWVTRPDGFHDYFNSRWYEFTGVSPGSTDGEGWNDMFHPDDRNRAWGRWRHCLATGESYEIEYRLRHRTGAYRWTLGRALPIRNERGEIERWFGTCTDIHDAKQIEGALKASEEKLKLALQTGKLGVWSVDLTTWVMTCSENCKANYGRSPGEPFSYADLCNCIHPEDRSRVEDQVRRAIADRTDYDSEYRTIWPDGATHWVLCRGRAAYAAADGRPLTMTGVSRDISQRKAAEEERAALLEAERAARAEAEHASRMKDEFLATLSHELRTPLNAILGWSQILSAGGGRDEQDLMEGLGVIQRNARAQTRIIEELLDMSRIISGKVRLEVQRVDLATLLEEAVNTVRPAADAKEIRLRAVLDSSSACVSGDPSRLQQVFWNLLTNAIKFTSRGGRVQVLLERVNSHLEVSVTDTGEGIAPEFLPHVFDRFRQADPSTTRRHGGLGLGLAIVKQLVELHGGSVRAKSPGPGKGSTLRVMLPLAVIHADEGPEPDRRHPRTPSRSVQTEAGCFTLEGVKVLVVDDEPDARALVKRLLEECRATALTAGSAAEALELIHLERPAVLVSDIGMPVEDGYSLIRRFARSVKTTAATRPPWL